MSEFVDRVVYEAALRRKDRVIAALKAELHATHHARIEAQNPGIESDPAWAAHKVAHDG